MSSNCTLSLGGLAFSTVLTSFVGTIVTGVSDGPLLALITAWLCWFAAIRLILVSLAGVVVTNFGPSFGFRQPFLYALPNRYPNDDEIALTPRPPSGGYGSENGNGNSDVEGAQIDISSTRDGRAGVNSAVGKTHVIKNNIDSQANKADAQVKPSIFSLKARNRGVSLAGAVGWSYALVYTPIMQILWLIVCWSKAPSLLLVARAVGVSVSALTYTIDTRARYGMAIGRRTGGVKVVPRLLNLYSATINLLLSACVVLLLSRAVVVALHSDSRHAFQIAIAPYIVLNLIWAYRSLKILWPDDKGWNGISYDPFWTCGREGSLTEFSKNIFLGIIVGAFAGAFVSAPAIALWQYETLSRWGQMYGRPTDGLDLGSWLNCTTDSWWRKAVYVLP